MSDGAGTQERVAGRELDAEVAEKVMGWTRTVRGVEGDEGVRQFDQWSTPEAEPNAGYVVIAPPLFSTNILAAWQVVEKMREHQPDESEIGGAWRDFWFVYGDSLADMTAAQAAQAICNAALDALASSPRSLPE